MSEDEPKPKKKNLSPNSPRKKACEAAIIQHLQVIGAREWNDVLNQFPDIPKSTIWRWIHRIRNDNPPQGVLADARKRIRNQMEGVRILAMNEDHANAVAGIARELPAMPSPAYVARNGEQAIANINFAAELPRLYSDANMLREYSIVIENGAERIKNPNTFDRSIERRARILETGIKTLEHIWDLRMMKRFYDAIVEEISKESPECQQRIMARLAALNAENGMAMTLDV